MKVLFIDDEPLIRKGLQVIIPWADYGFTEFFEAEDGTEGLALIEKENPELIMLDIHMEKMSGLSLAKTLRENDYNCRIIILSGYSDFSYAKAAITCGVTDYLVKPVDPKMLIEAVEKAIGEIQKEQMISIFSEQPTHMAQNNILSDILLGKLSYKPEMKNIYYISLDCGPYRLFSVYTGEKYDFTPKQADFLKQLQKTYLTANISDSETVFITTDTAQTRNLKKQLETAFETKVLTSDFIVVVSNMTTGHDGLALLYGENAKILQNIYYHKNNGDNMIWAENLSPTPDNKSLPGSNLVELTTALLENILLLNSQGVDTLTAELYRLLADRKPPRDSINFMLLNCYTQIVTQLFGHYPALEFELADNAKFTARLYADQYLFDSIDYLKKQLQKAVAYIQSVSQASPCQRICQYVEANYSSPLKLETIAELFGYNSAYLGKLFAKETGHHFNTYLDNVRIKHAKELLEKGISVTHTCELAGFSNTDYFTKKFKKYEGMLPSEYRKIHAPDL